MKTALLTLALVAVAGAAGAQSPISGGMSTGPTTGAATLNNSAVTNGNTGMQGAQMGVGTQAQMNSNIQSPATGQMNTDMNSNGMSGASANSNLANAPALPTTGAARTAQKRIEQDGYKSVQNLQQGSDGLWHGTAMRGNASVQVTVDHAGHVAAQ